MSSEICGFPERYWDPAVWRRLGETIPARSLPRSHGGHPQLDKLVRRSVSDDADRTDGSNRFSASPPSGVRAARARPDAGTIGVHQRPIAPGPAHPLDGKVVYVRDVTDRPMDCSSADRDETHNVYEVALDVSHGKIRVLPGQHIAVIYEGYPRFFTVAGITCDDLGYATQITFHTRRPGAASNYLIEAEKDVSVSLFGPFGHNLIPPPSIDDSNILYVSSGYPVASFLAHLDQRVQRHSSGHTELIHWRRGSEEYYIDRLHGYETALPDHVSRIVRGQDIAMRDELLRRADEVTEFLQQHRSYIYASGGRLTSRIDELLAEVFERVGFDGRSSVRALYESGRLRVSEPERIEQKWFDQILNNKPGIPARDPSVPHLLPEPRLFRPVARP